MLATPWSVIWTNGRRSFPTDSSAGKPQNEVELSLISGQVVKPQPRCGRRRRSKACVSTVTTMVSQRSPLTCCWGLCLQWESVAIVILAVAGDGRDVFIGGEIQSFFFWYRFTIKLMQFFFGFRPQSSACAFLWAKKGFVNFFQIYRPINVTGPPIWSFTLSLQWGNQPKIGFLDP